MTKILILGIETSCDETAASVVERAIDGRAKILSNIVHSQIECHRAFGGVVPEIAARAHVEVLDGTICAALQDADVAFADLDAIAVTAGPGLIGGLLVGTMTAKALAAVRSIPLLGINHLEGHALTARLTDNVAFPYLLFLLSGGHTQLLIVEGVGKYQRLGTTIDDALGEAFDKAAKLLGLGFPGGPAVEAAARAGDSSRFELPRPLLGSDGCNFSFSGLKSAMRRTAMAVAPLDGRGVCDLCASFQQAVSDILADRLENAVRIATASRSKPATLVVAGGVAANSQIRSRLAATAAEVGLAFVAPPAALCTDNAAMIAWAGAERLAAGIASGGDIIARARWPLDEDAEPVVGTGTRGAKV